MNINGVRVKLNQKNNSQKFIDHFQGYIQERVFSLSHKQKKGSAG